MALVDRVISFLILSALAVPGVGLVFCICGMLMHVRVTPAISGFMSYTCCYSLVAGVTGVILEISKDWKLKP